MNWTLKYFTQVNGLDSWFESMSPIGPKLTQDPAKAMRFPSKEDAERHPAFFHPLCILEAALEPS